MATIVILIRHNHDRAVAELLGNILRVHFAHLESNYLDQVLNLSILSDLLGRGITHVQ